MHHKQQLQEKDVLLQQRQDEIAARMHQNLQLRQQLKEQEQVTVEIQQTNHSLQRQVEQLQKQLSQQSLKPPQPQPQMIFNWRDGGKAPFEMSRGAAVVDGKMAYFMN